VTFLSSHLVTSLSELPREWHDVLLGGDKRGHLVLGLVDPGKLCVWHVLEESIALVKKISTPRNRFKWVAGFALEKQFYIFSTKKEIITWDPRDDTFEVAEKDCVLLPAKVGDRILVGKENSIEVWGLRSSKIEEEVISQERISSIVGISENMFGVYCMGNQVFQIFEKKFEKFEPTLKAKFLRITSDVCHIGDGIFGCFCDSQIRIFLLEEVRTGWIRPIPIFPEDVTNPIRMKLSKFGILLVEARSHFDEDKNRTHSKENLLLFDFLAKTWDLIFFWVFLGSGDSTSRFFLPTEVTFAMVSSFFRSSIRNIFY
jgi:hypothetical protein